MDSQSRPDTNSVVDPDSDGVGSDRHHFANPDPTCDINSVKFGIIHKLINFVVIYKCISLERLIATFKSIVDLKFIHY